MMRILYLLNIFPTISETFISNEIQAFLDRGHDITLCSLWAVDSEKIAHRTSVRHHLTDRTHYLPTMVNEALCCKSYAESIVTVEARLKAGLLTAEERERLVEFKNGGKLQFSRESHHVLAVLLLLKLLKECRAEHIHCHFGDVNAEFAYLLHQITGVPYTLTLHGYDIYFKPHPELAELATRAKKVITVSEHNRNYITRELRCSGDTIKIISCGIDLNLFKPIPLKKDKIFTIVSVGRLHPVKGYTFFVEALRLLSDTGLKFRCWIIGEGEEETSIKHQISMCRLGRHVSLLGSKPNEDLPRYYNKADVCVLSSISEGSPMVLKESLACGTPVIATRVGGIPEIVRHYENGILVEPKNSKELARKIGELAHRPDLLARLKNNARLGIEEQFDIKKNVKSLEDIFLSTL